MTGRLDPDVTYWETDTTDSVEFDPPEAPGVYLELALDGERPMRDGKPIERKGNRGYPTMVRIDADECSGSVLSDTARDIGRALIALADKADAIDHAEFGCPGCGSTHTVDGRLPLRHLRPAPGSGVCDHLAFRTTPLPHPAPVVMLPVLTGAGVRALTAEGGRSRTADA